jgi:hypothetical protein
VRQFEHLKDAEFKTMRHNGSRQAPVALFGGRKRDLETQADLAPKPPAPQGTNEIALVIDDAGLPEKGHQQYGYHYQG